MGQTVMGADDGNGNLGMIAGTVTNNNYRYVVNSKRGHLVASSPGQIQTEHWTIFQIVQRSQT